MVNLADLAKKFGSGPRTAFAKQFANEADNSVAAMVYSGGASPVHSFEGWGAPSKWQSTAPGEMGPKPPVIKNSPQRQKWLDTLGKYQSRPRETPSGAPFMNTRLSGSSFGGAMGSMAVGGTLGYMTGDGSAGSFFKGAAVGLGGAAATRWAYTKGHNALLRSGIKANKAHQSFQNPGDFRANAMKFGIQGTVGSLANKVGYATMGFENRSVRRAAYLSGAGLAGMMGTSRRREKRGYSSSNHSRGFNANRGNNFHR